MWIVDAHLDLAYNASRGRDPTDSAISQPMVENEIATVGLPDLRAGKVKLVCATIFAEPKSAAAPDGYTDAESARKQAITQLNWYHSCVDRKILQWARKSADLDHLSDDRTTAILLMEGADPLRGPEDVAEWFDAGLRMVGLAWKQTRFAGGTGAPGPITPAGIALVRELDRFHIIHDTSHLAEESFWNLLDLSAGPVVASHSNCRAIVGEGDRHLTDDMIKAIAQRGGVIGINFFDKFLLPKSEYTHRRATLKDVVAHMQHICNLAGSAHHVAIGTDMDGGLGREQIPQEIKTSADLSRVAHALADAGFSDPDIEGIMHQNWRGFFERFLLGSSSS